MFEVVFKIFCQNCKNYEQIVFKFEKDCLQHPSNDSLHYSFVRLSVHPSTLLPLHVSLHTSIHSFTSSCLTPHIHPLFYLFTPHIRPLVHPHFHQSPSSHRFVKEEVMLPIFLNLMEYSIILSPNESQCCY